MTSRKHIMPPIACSPQVLVRKMHMHLTWITYTWGNATEMSSSSSPTILTSRCTAHILWGWKDRAEEAPHSDDCKAKIWGLGKIKLKIQTDPSLDSPSLRDRCAHSIWCPWSLYFLAQVCKCLLERNADSFIGILMQKEMLSGFAYQWESLCGYSRRFYHSRGELAKTLLGRNALTRISW